MLISEIDYKEYSFCLEKCSYSTYYHTVEWFHMWKAIRKATFKIFKIELDGNSIFVPLLVEKKFKILKTAHSSPCGTYGGIISYVAIHDNLVLKIYKALARKFHQLIITGNPYNKYNIGRHFTQVINMDLDTKIIEQSFSKGIHKRLRKTTNSSLKLVKLSKTQVDIIYSLYCKRLKEWDTPTNRYKKIVFNQLAQLQNSDLWGVEFENEIIVAGCVLKHKDKIFHWFGVSNVDFKNLNAFTFYYYELIKFYQDHSFKFYDFNPSGGHQSVVNFKASFGSKKLYYQNASFESRTFKLLKFAARLKAKL